MPQTILLLCCLTLLTASAATREVNRDKNFTLAFAGSTMVERVNFHRIVGETLKSTNKIYKPKETGDILMQCLQIVIELLNEVSGVSSEKVEQFSKAFTDYLRNSTDLHEDWINYLKRKLDENYENMMEIVHSNAVLYTLMLDKGNLSEKERSQVESLKIFFTRLEQLPKIGKADHTLEHTISTIYRFYHALPKMSILRRVVCKLESKVAFAFTREGFINFFHDFIKRVDLRILSHTLDQNGLHQHAVKLKKYFNNVLDFDAMDALSSLYKDTEHLMTRLHITLAVAFRPEAYFMTMDDFKSYGERTHEYFARVLAGLNMTQVSKPMEIRGISVPQIVAGMKDSGAALQVCTQFIRMLPSAIRTKEGFNAAATEFCQANAKLQEDLILYAQLIERIVTYFGHALTTETFDIGKKALTPGTLYPDNDFNPIEHYPDLTSAKEKIYEYVLPVNKTQVDIYYEHLLNNQVRFLLDVMYGTKVCA